ncbi:glycosyltransferase family 1 protein [Arthrobacter sp. YAF34]|uniref:rhamnosyltransferase WsaF family glycosyltransferase n=1 Tax=Arthrobacter sp. YAF34 TaxID=3233083 RepID=UPI003F930D57
MVLEHSAAAGLLRRVRTAGTGDVIGRIARRAARHLESRFETAALDFPLLPHDVADSTRLQLASAMPGSNDGPGLAVAWLCTPPGPGSGGHTTLFRMVRGMEQRGHRCTILLYDRHGGDLNRQRGVIRRHWPDLSADIKAAPDRLEGFDACVASSWDTAHVLASRGRAGMHRFYFVQDFEPFFYPRGSLYSLAEDSYRFGFHHIALGEMVGAALRENVGVESSVVAFGCDTEVYGLQNRGSRSGVVFYARESADRRGFLLARLALEEFHRRYPEQQIHVYGDPVNSWKVPHTHYGKLSPARLNTLYNSALAGLAMSFTNISLVAEEMLAAGMIPVVNDHRYARLDLPHPHVAWAPATPGGLADALGRIVTDVPRMPVATLSSGTRSGWGETQDAFAAAVESEVAACRI